jgi:hypothetical protein
MLRRAARAAMSSVLLGAAQCRCRRTPDPGFASTTEVFVDEHRGRAARRAVPPTAPPSR